MLMFPGSGWFGRSMAPSPTITRLNLVRSWRNLCADFSFGFRKCIGNGFDTCALNDPLVFDLPLIAMPTFVSIDVDLSGLLVRHFIMDHAWNPEMLALYFGPLVVARILSIPLAQEPDDDRWVWAPAPSGSARPSSAYWFPQDNALESRSVRTDWCFVWRLRIHPR